MKKILFLSSAFLMTMAGAHAADNIITNANTCTVDVLGVADNNATANTIATWDLINYECGAGQYLLNSDGVLECTECPVGSYCPGGTYTVESDTNGKNTCPADYTSDAGAVGENECYMGCELACTQQTCPEHSTSCTNGDFKVTGKQYVNATCNAYPSLCPIEDLTCDTGYTKTFIDVSQLPYGSNFINVSCPLDNDPSDNSASYNYCEYETSPGEYFVSSDPADFGARYVFSVNKYGPDTQGVTIKTYNDENGETKTVYTLSHADFKSGLNGGNHVWYRPDELLFLDSNERFIFDVATEFAHTGEISQKSFDRLENEFSPEVQEDVLNALAELGDNPSHSKMQQVAFRLYKTYVNSVKTNVPWIYLGEYDEATMNNFYLRKTVEYYSNFFTQNFTETGATYCKYHTINIDWNPDNNGAHIQNQCFYDGGIDIPDDPVKPGYTFTGWKLVE